MKKGTVNLGLMGSTGRMGLAVEQLIAHDLQKKLNPFLAIGKETSKVFSITAENIDSVESEILEDVDVWIDFSSPEGFRKLLEATQKPKAAVVSGTTGLIESDFAKLKKNSKKRALFWASNLSPGLWAFRQALKSFSSIAEFDFAIDEIHHTQKKDQPSGTAKTLHQDLEKVVGRKLTAPKSHRLGGVFGVHNVIAASKNEVITFQHQALNRSVFAEGAIKAAVWLASQKPGLYSMDDLYFRKN